MNDQRLRWSWLVWWACQDLNLGPHPYQGSHTSWDHWGQPGQHGKRPGQNPDWQSEFSHRLPSGPDELLENCWTEEGKVHSLHDNHSGCRSQQDQMVVSPVDGFGPKVRNPLLPSFREPWIDEPSASEITRVRTPQPPPHELGHLPAGSAGSDQCGSALGPWPLGERRATDRIEPVGERLHLPTKLSPRRRISGKRSGLTWI
jgi:hypothetical protein